MHVVWNGIDVAKIDARVTACCCDYRHQFFGTSAIKVAVLVGNIKPQKDYRLALRSRTICSSEITIGVCCFLATTFAKQDPIRQKLLSC